MSRSSASNPAKPGATNTRSAARPSAPSRPEAPGAQPILDPGIWEVAVLCLLRERGMHPYEMQRLARHRHWDKVLVLKKGSLYHAIRRLLAARLIEIVGTEKEGKRPERTTYRISAAGEKTLPEWLRARIGNVQPERSGFMASVNFLIHLKPAEAAEEFAKRAASLAEQIKEMQTTVREIGPRAGRVNLLETEYALAMRRAELAWVESIVKELRVGKLDWNLEATLRQLRAETKSKKAR